MNAEILAGCSHAARLEDTPSAARASVSVHEQYVLELLWRELSEPHEQLVSSQECSLRASCFRKRRAAPQPLKLAAVN